MNKITALKILINDSALNQEEKNAILQAVDTMTEQEIDALGTTFANQRKSDMIQAKKALAELDALQATLE